MLTKRISYLPPETESCVPAVVDLQYDLKGIKGGEWGSLCSRVTGETGPKMDGYFQELISWSQSFFSLGSVASGSLWPHGWQHSRHPCPSPSTRACSNSCPLSQWSHPTISSSVDPFSSTFNLPDSGSLLMSWLSASCGQSIGASASASVLPNEYPGLVSFRIDWLDLLAVQGTLNSLLQHHSSKASILWRSTFFMAQLSYP